MSHEVIILGGGLAGLTLAIQLRQQFKQLDILILERRRHPVPAAAHKVGESSVEIGAHYFDTVLGLREHLSERQLKKFGFRFFFSEGREDLDAVLELGASRYLSTPTYQIERGTFENFLAEHARALGVQFLDGAHVRGFELGSEGTGHRVRFEVDGLEREAQSRWLIDASGRAGLLKRRLGLAQSNAHDVNAVWFRVGARIDVDEWSTNREWLERCDPPSRWLSTNHLCGPGYWVWLIPLVSGSHSIGIVCDAKAHPLQTMDTFEKALAWLEVHQPRLARDIANKRHLLQDFRFLRDFSYGCKQVFSAQRWALTGEAGVFLDPFYSPGSDFIAIANTYISDLIAQDLAGEAIAGRAHVYQQLYFSFYDSTMSLYREQYDLFGDPQVLPVKVIWDYAYYWGVLCQLFFQRRLTDIATIARLSDELNHAKALNLAMQGLLRDWSRHSAKRNAALMLDQLCLPWFVELNRGLRDELDTAAFRERIKQHVALLDTLAREILERARSQCPQLEVSAVASLLGAAGADGACLLFGEAA